MAERNKGGRPPKARGAPNSSDAADARWTVRGVPLNVRGMATKAAADKGLTVGDWLAEAIIAYARQTPAEVPADAGAVAGDQLPAVQLPADLAETLRLIHERLAGLEQARRPILARLFGGPVRQAEGFRQTG